jgi:adenine-specific DNA methylase
MTDTPRLIERAFPLKQASLDSVHEKNVRHGHISTLHIWPARRPLAACRAALIATLLPDPGTPEARRELCEKIGGTVVQKVERKKMPDGRVVERIKEETEGGILHWKRETENADTLDWFRQEIRKAYGGRAPRVLDPFAGGGAIPLEAMRLGCEVTAADINPVAWFILKCTLEYPQKLAGKTHPLPEFILGDEEFMAAFHKTHPHLPGGSRRGRQTAMALEQDARPQAAADTGQPPEADLAWQVRAWGRWVLARARKELARFYPTYADFEALRPGKVYERQPMRLVPLREDGTADIAALNAEFSKDYLADKRNPRWVAKPTVAYLWARTVTCKNCRATVPLLKTRWLCKKANKRVLLTMEPNAGRTGVVFRIENGVPVKGGNAAQRREHDKRIGAGTMSRAGATCPCCGTIMTMEDIRLEGKAGRLGAVMTVVIADGRDGKGYRLPTVHEIEMAEKAEAAITDIFTQIPFGLPEEPLPSKEALGFRVPLYGLDQWKKLFTPRQLVTLGTTVKYTRAAKAAIERAGYPPEQVEGLLVYLAIAVDRIADASSTIAHWQPGSEFNVSTFQRFALPMSWDFSEVNVLAGLTGSYLGALDWIALVLQHVLNARLPERVTVLRRSVLHEVEPDSVDLVITDPPYYDAIPYSDLMDFFYIWLRRCVGDEMLPVGSEFTQPLSPKWDHTAGNGELIDDSARFGGNAAASRQNYEDGMARAFLGCNRALRPGGRFVIVFANKQPDAWETLVSATIRAGFVVDGSWPIQTERQTRTRSLASAALSSSVWLVCYKRPATARPGWDNKVLEEMRANIAGRLREFWDAGIRGPDFVWAATGPALEAYSRHPVVRKANDPGAAMGVGEFLSHARRMVVDYVVGQVLTGEAEGADLAAAERMDAPTAYYLLHRHDFGLDEAPSGACILYATACGLSDSALESTWDLLARSGGSGNGANGDDGEDEAADPDAEADAEPADSGSRVKLKTWAQRKHRSMGYEAPSGQTVPLIDRIHRLMHLWRAGEVLKVDEYLDEHGLRRQELFKRLLQSLIELSRKDGQSQELQTLESLSNHVQGKGARADYRQTGFAVGDEA